MLLVLCGVAIARGEVVGSHIASASRAVVSADLFQDARAQAAIEDAGASRYILNSSTEALHAEQAAAAALDQTLASISTSEHGTSAGPLRQLAAQHATYDGLARQMVDLVDSDQADAARRVLAEMESLSNQIDVQLGALEESHHLVAVARLRTLDREATLLRIGTPIALVLAMLVLGGSALVNRANRRSMQQQALHDALTGLPNRLLFADRASHALAAGRRTGSEPVVMMLDLDRFKEVNDTLGHREGDRLLVGVAERLIGSVRPGDTVARLGGDEFAILLVDGGIGAGSLAAARILKALEPPFDLDGVTVSIEASIGLATTGDLSGSLGAADAVLAADLLRHADIAMYEAKAQRCGYRSFAGDDNAPPARLAMLGELRNALDNDELVLHYQPKVAADTGELIGVEALVRWQHPTRGLLQPAEFIGLAESTTLIQRLTTIVIDKALALVRERLEDGVRLPVAVNISARSLLNSGFPATIADQLDHAGVPAQLLCLELTESTMMSDPDKALGVIRELHAMGVRLSVDDFGTGYSSMAYLKVLPVDEIKIDRSFVTHMTTDNDDAMLVQSAIDLGHNLGLSVVAEGVEDSATLIALK
ncbi:MAG TPA: EAL domain-containing protein, partial [Acidothermaceae bacterium]|nr:EAL domain-containing protein [Acidothermaceae bacterium]